MELPIFLPAVQCPLRQRWDIGINADAEGWVHPTKRPDLGLQFHRLLGEYFPAQACLAG